jgi:GGDEF domain-containing protein
MKNKLYRLALGSELIAPAGELDGSYPSVDALLDTLKTPASVLLDGISPENVNSLTEAFTAVCRLRRSAVFYAAPIYSTVPLDNFNAFVDGIGSTKAGILPHAQQIIAKLETIPLEANAANDDLRLLTFLYCRGDAVSLSPVAFAASPWIYEYPAAYLIGGFAATAIRNVLGINPLTAKSAFTVTLPSSAEWVASLSAQGFLVTTGLVDRIRICPYCQTGNLNYIDACPLCGSIDFTKKKMIHCFTCSHVAPEENFNTGMLLVCPRCHVTLRHIGSDYDRPVESYVCNSCSGHFIEPEVKADCFKCRQKSAAEDLAVRQLYNYGLTAKGKKAVQFGVFDVEFSLFDSNRNVLPLYFYQVTDWLLQMKLRYSDEDFALLGIKIGGLETIESTAGISRYKNVLDELARRIRELVRSTDITTSTGVNTFWVLLPRTSQQGGEILAARIEKLTELVSGENELPVTILVKCYSIPAEYARHGAVAKRLLCEFEAALHDGR